MLEILSEQLLYEQGSFRRVRRWLRGKHPEMGALIPPHAGLSGEWETVVEVSVVLPLQIIEVDKGDDPGGLSGVTLGGVTPLL